MIGERMALRATVAPGWAISLRVTSMAIASMQEERCRVTMRKAKAEEGKQRAKAELQRLSCWKQNVEVDLQGAEAERDAEAEEDAELMECLELRVDGWTAQCMGRGIVGRRGLAGGNVLEGETAKQSAEDDRVRERAGGVVEGQSGGRQSGLGRAIGTRYGEKETEAEEN